MEKLWKSYEKAVKRNCTGNIQDETQITYWRNSMFTTTVLYLIPLSVIAIVPGVYMAIITNLPMLLAADFFVVATFVVIAFNKRLDVNTRKLLLIFSLYFVTVVLLYYLGSFGPGLLYLLAITIFVTLIFDVRYAVGSVIANLLICMVFGILIFFEKGSGSLILEYQLNSWIAVSSNLMFVCAVSVLLIPKLFQGLQQAFDKKNLAEQKLTRNQIQLEKSLYQLEEKNRELEDFAYIASHDLKEPLRMVRNFMNLLKKRYEKELDERALTYIHYATDGAQRMNTLIDDLLEYSRIGRLHLEKKSVNLNNLVEDIKKIFIRETVTQSPVIISEHLPDIEAVPVSIKLLFQNLISNSVKYQDGTKTPEISISHKDAGSHWKFMVEDNGIGIPSEYYDQIFHIFKRLHSGSEYIGSGMGLAICKKVVIQHGGEIWVESSEGKGSTFSFTIAKSDHSGS